MKSNKKSKGWLSEIDSITAARTTAKQGCWAAIFVATITAVLVSVSLTTPDPEIPLDAWSFIDAGLFAAIAWGIHKMSRIAAIAGLALYIIEIIYKCLNGSFSSSGTWLVIIITLAFINSVRGTFAYHKLRSN
ncbi:MAG: hypothetical protein F6K31_08565 [Symploca sp. SIO2G7]|nr:hypothetical protein [Symploca sp. SIO2G7]